MGTLLASSIIASARRILLDPSPGVTWDDTALLQLINEAERAIVRVKHEAIPTRVAINLAAGAQQTIPAAHLCLMDLYENTTGQKRRPRLVDRTLQDVAASTYPGATQEAEVREWTKDDRDPRRFAVFPPNKGSGSVMALLGTRPVALDDVGDAINVDDIYEQVVIDFVLARAYGENSQRQDLTKSAAYGQAWQSALGISTQSQIGVSPKVQAQGGTR